MSLLSSFSIPGIIKHILRLGANITETQLTNLKWKLSDEGKACYSQKEINDFYISLEKGDTDVLDITSFEKQQRINKLIEDIKNE